MKTVIAIGMLLLVLVACGPATYQTKESCEGEEGKTCMFNNCDSKSENKHNILQRKLNEVLVCYSIVIEKNKHVV